MIWPNLNWPPSRRVVVAASILTALTGVVLAVMAILPDGLARELVRDGFLVFLVVAVLLAVYSRARGLERDPTWTLEREDEQRE